MTNQQARLLRTKVLGAKIRQCRLSSGKTIKETASLIGVTSSVFSSYEKGRKGISLPELEIFSYHLNIPLRTFQSGAPMIDNDKPSIHPEYLIPLRQRMIAAKLRSRRKELGLSLRQVTKDIGIPPSRLSSYERGESSIPLPMLESLVTEFDLSLDDFVENHGPISRWINRQHEIESFLMLPDELRAFLTEPSNESYLYLAQKLSQIPPEKLHALAEGLLEITA